MQRRGGQRLCSPELVSFLNTSASCIFWTMQGPLSSGNTPAFVPLQWGWFCCSHFGCFSDHEKQHALVLESSADHGSRWSTRGEHFQFYERNRCVPADWGYWSFSVLPVTLTSLMHLHHTDESVFLGSHMNAQMKPCPVSQHSAWAQLGMDPQKMRWLRRVFIYMCLNLLWLLPQNSRLGTLTTDVLFIVL